MKGNAEIVTMLLDHGATGAERLLLAAAGKGQTALVRALAARPGISPKTLTQALSSANAGKHSETAAVLHAAGAKAASPMDEAALKRFEGKYAGEGQGRELLTVSSKALCSR